MADTDPFGRDKGEDPLAAMGWTSSAGVDATAASDVAAPEQPDEVARREARAERVALRAGGGPQAPATPSVAGVPGVRRRGNAGCAFAVVVLGFLIAVFAVVVPAVLDAIDTVEDEVERVIPTVPEPPSVPSDDPGRDRPATPDRPPRGLERTSLLRRGNLAPALRRLRRVTGSARVHLVRIDAASVIVTAPVGGDRVRVARATWDGEGDVLSTSPGGAGQTSFPWSAIDASAPNRIVRAATRGRSAAAFDYLVLLDAAGLRWSAFLKGGTTFSAAPDGTAVTRVGG